MKTIKNFTKKQQPKRRQSKLKPYEKEIKELYHKGYKVEQIQEFLQENGIEITVRGIRWFLKLNQNLSKKFSFKNPAVSKSKNENTSQNEDTVSFQNLKKLVKG